MLEVPQSGDPTQVSLREDSSWERPQSLNQKEMRLELKQRLS